MKEFIVEYLNLIDVSHILEVSIRHETNYEAICLFEVLYSDCQIRKMFELEPNIGSHYDYFSI